MKLLISALFFITIAKLTIASECRSQKPVIGILSQYLNEPGYPSSANYIAASYVKFMEMFGARVVPVFPNRTAEYYQYLIERLNGILLPGGSSSIHSGAYFVFSKLAYDHSWKLFNETEEVFPILGICLGFEQLIELAAEDHVLSSTDSDDLLAPIEITNYGWNESRLFKHAPNWILQALDTKDLAPNFHQYSLLASTYEKSEKLQDVFEVIAYGYDRNEEKFVSIVEGKTHPLLAFQYHPEKNLFEWSTEYKFAHNFLAASASQYVGDYFVQLTRYSCQRFESVDDLIPYLIYNYNATYTQDMFSGEFTQMYIFGA